MSYEEVVEVVMDNYGMFVMYELDESEFLEDVDDGKFNDEEEVLDSLTEFYGIDFY